MKNTLHRIGHGIVLTLGLAFGLIGASLGAQFEAMSCDWLNMNGRLPDMVCSGDIHCSAAADGAGR